VGGWEFTTINTGPHGTPIDVVYSASGNNIVSSLSTTIAVSRFCAPCQRRCRQPEPFRMLNTFFRRLHIQHSVAPAEPFGDVGRNAFRAPNFDQWDCSIDKNFQIREKAGCNSGPSSFNVLNHTNFGIPDTKTTDAAFGTIRATFPSRQGQFAPEADVSKRRRARHAYPASLRTVSAQVARAAGIRSGIANRNFDWRRVYCSASEMLAAERPHRLAKVIGLFRAAIPAGKDLSPEFRNFEDGRVANAAVSGAVCRGVGAGRSSSRTASATLEKLLTPRRALLQNHSAL